MSTVPPAAPGGVPQKKSSALPWILGGVGGCLTLIIICVVAGYFFIAHKAKQAGLDSDLIKRNPALAAAKMAVAVNPEVELVSTDEGRGTITIRNKKDGKVMTMSFEDAKNGHFTMKEEGGSNASVTFGGKAKYPSWVPEYPGSDPQGAFTAQGAEGESGTFGFKTKDSTDKVVSFYQDKFKSANMKITSTISNESGGQMAGMLQGTDEAGKHVVTVVVGSENGETSVAVTYATNK